MVRKGGIKRERKGRGGGGGEVSDGLINMLIDGLLKRSFCSI